MRNLILFSSLLLFISCQNELEKKIEQRVVSGLNNPKSYEFVNLKLIDSISNHEYSKILIDSLAFQVNQNSYRILNSLYDNNEQKELKKIQSERKKLRLLKEKYLSSNSKNIWKKIEITERRYDYLRKEYENKKKKEYFGGLDYSTFLEENTIIWDSLIKMSRTKLNRYLNLSEPSFKTRFGIDNDSVIKTFKLVDSLQIIMKEAKPEINFYIFELNYRETNKFNAKVLNKLRVTTLSDKRTLYSVK